jgi:hypothetical protein
MKEGTGRRQLSLPPHPFLPSLLSLPANFKLVTRSKIPVQIFQQPKTLALAIQKFPISTVEQLQDV